MNGDTTRRWFLASLGLAGLAIACTPRRALQLADGERLVIDLRAPAEFAAGHAEGALNLQTGYDQLAARIAAYVPDPSAPLALRAGSRAAAERAAALLAERGYRDLALARSTGEASTLPLIGAAELRARLASAAPPVVLDVRSAEEHEDGALPGALLLDPDEAPRRVLELDRAASYAVICEGGWRSSQLASWMVREGFSDVVNVIDGMAGWRQLDAAPVR